MYRKPVACWPLWVSAILSFTPLSSAQGYRFVVDPAQSQITTEVTIDYLFLNDTDSDSAAVRGWIDATMDPNAAPFSTIHITDMNLELTKQIDLTFDFGFWGQGRVTGTNVAMRIDQPGPPVPVQTDNTFSQPENLLAVRGTLEYSMPIIGGDVVDLAGIDPFEAGLTGTLVQEGTTIRAKLGVDLELPLVVSDIPAGTVRFVGSLVAEAEFWCVADLNFDGIVNGQDFNRFASQWQKSGPSLTADLDGNRIVNLPDLCLFVSDWLRSAIWYVP